LSAVKSQAELNMKALERLNMRGRNSEVRIICRGFIFFFLILSMLG
jgi:hypothetical protein